MPSPLLAKARRAGREIVSVTPERAGWHYVGFRALRLADGETESLDTGDQELCVVVLTGRVDVTVAAQTFAGLGTRDSVFDPVAPAAVYVPPGQPVRIRARGAQAEYQGTQDTDDSGRRHPHWLHTPAVNMLLPATLNSSCPCGIGRLIQYAMRAALVSCAFVKICPPPCSTVSRGLASRRLCAGEPITVAPCDE